MPSGFDYYALGHIHDIAIHESQGKLLAYTGNLFPSSFSEIESKQFGNFFIIEKQGKKINIDDIKRVSLDLRNIVPISIDANNESSSSLQEKIIKELKRHNLKNAIITLRISGILDSGKPSDIDFGAIDNLAKELGSYYLLRNTFQLTTKEFEQYLETAEEMKTVDEIESEALAMSIQEDVISAENREIFLPLMKLLNIEKDESETVANFSAKLSRDMFKLLNLNQ